MCLHVNRTVHNIDRFGPEPSACPAFLSETVRLWPAGFFFLLRLAREMWSMWQNLGVFVGRDIISLSLYIYIHIYIYMYTEREREMYVCMYVYIYIYTLPQTCSVFAPTANTTDAGGSNGKVQAR